MMFAPRVKSGMKPCNGTPSLIGNQKPKSALNWSRFHHSLDVVVSVRKHTGVVQLKLQAGGPIQ